jgi:hypothetical protein
VVVLFVKELGMTCLLWDYSLVVSPLIMFLAPNLQGPGGRPGFGRGSGGFGGAPESSNLASE